MYICLHACVYVEKCRSIYYVFILCICTQVYCHSICRNTLQHTATHCNTLQHACTQVYCHSICRFHVSPHMCLHLRRVSLHMSIKTVSVTRVCCSVLQCVAVCFSVSLHISIKTVSVTRVCCSVLQCVAVCCSVSLHMSIKTVSVTRVSTHVSSES